MRKYNWICNALCPFIVVEKRSALLHQLIDNRFCNVTHGNWGLHEANWTIAPTKSRKCREITPFRIVTVFLSSRGQMPLGRSRDFKTAQLNSTVGVVSYDVLNGYLSFLKLWKETNSAIEQKFWNRNSNFWGDDLARILDELNVTIKKKSKILGYQYSHN